jgi:peptide-methionine (S)-S-oxide reductase
MQSIVFASGCFWCTEAVFQRIQGVTAVVSGYTDGDTDNPSYYRVANGNTGHAEAIKIVYDPQVVSLDVLLAVFFTTHDPTSLNRQGADVGTEYRSAIFYTTDEEKTIINQYISQLEKDTVFARPIVTQVVPVQTFYPAESEHQSFYNNNKDFPYCQVVIEPKLAKLRQKFGAFLKG